MDQNKINRLVRVAAQRRQEPANDRLRTEHMTIWKSMTGGEQAAAMKEIKRTEEKPFPSTAAHTKKETPAVATPKGKTKEKPVAAATPATAVETAAEKPVKVKKEKVVPPPIEYNFDKKHADVGRRVFTAHGTAIVRGVDTEKNHYTVTIEDGAETVKVLSMKSVRFKAFNEDFRDKYVVDKTVRTASGAYSVSNQDDVAKSLNGLTVEQLSEIATKAGLAERFATWGSVNAGMKRMNLSNVFRAVLKEGTKYDEKQVAAAKGALSIAIKMKRPDPPKKVMTDEQKAKLAAGKAAKTKTKGQSAQEAMVAADAAKAAADAAKPKPKGKKETVKV